MKRDQRDLLEQGREGNRKAPELYLNDENQRMEKRTETKLHIIKKKGNLFIAFFLNHRIIDKF